MDKEQFRIQIYHNRYTRGVVVTICKILIWSLIYALVVAVCGSIMATSIGIDINNVANVDYATVNVGPGTIISSIIIVIATVVFYWAVIAAILRKIKQNREIDEVEDKYLKGKSSK